MQLPGWPHGGAPPPAPDETGTQLNVKQANFYNISPTLHKPQFNWSLILMRVRLTLQTCAKKNPSIIQPEQKVFYWRHLFLLEQKEAGCPLPPPQGSEVTERRGGPVFPGRGLVSTPCKEGGGSRSVAGNAKKHPGRCILAWSNGVVRHGGGIRLEGGVQLWHKRPFNRKQITIRLHSSSSSPTTDQQWEINYKHPQ